MASNMNFWGHLPPKIQAEIIRFLPSVGGNCGQLVTVCRAWQTILEPLNFAEISLTVPRLTDPESRDILSRKRNLIRYIWFHTDRAECPPEYERNDPAHGWIDGRQIMAPSWIATEHVFYEIMASGPFDDDLTEMEWWRSLPLVPVVGGVLFRQQTRRRWDPVTLASMLTRFPNIQELCYEPWRELGLDETQTDRWTQNLIESFSSTQLCKLTIFENFNESYQDRLHRMLRLPFPAIRVPNPAVSQELARASLHLKTLSASFMVDAGYFFAARQRSWTWDLLTSLALTSSTLTNDTNPMDINNMLQSAAAAALKMPNLDTIEIWNGRRGLAMVFRYERARDRQPATITIRGTWEFELAPAVRQAWDAVAHEEVIVQRSLIDLDKIRSHGDAIRELGLSAEVVRPVSLQQILIENRFRG
ncbi:hypothetical protein QYS62_009460 [Fusarium acuminatum]|uniref:DUF6546 domain-containing protein n=1 Tax=Fusarium acuminatum TaxID=5515 RepID=A0ABZ2X7R7_9HYPO